MIPVNEYMDLIRPKTTVSYLIRDICSNYSSIPKISSSKVFQSLINSELLYKGTDGHYYPTEKGELCGFYTTFSVNFIGERIPILALEEAGQFFFIDYYLNYLVPEHYSKKEKEDF